MAHPVIHFEFGAADGAGLAAFYKSLFDWRVEPAGPEYWLLSPGDGSVGGAVLQVSEGVPSYLAVYVAIDDLEQSLAKAEELGASQLVPETTVPGVGTFAMIRDPAGNMVGLMKEAGSGWAVLQQLVEDAAP